MSSSPPVPGFTKYGRHSLRYPESLRPATAVASPGAVINLAKPPLSVQNRGRKSARMHKRLAGLFKRSKETDNGGLRLHPAFMDDDMFGGPSSPDSSFRGRSSSGSGKSMFKIFPAKRNNGEEDEISFVWKPCKANCEWESAWGHHMTLQSLNTTELSKVEMECLQRVAIGRLQGMEISVSYSLLKVSPVRGVLQRLSMRKRPSTVDSPSNSSNTAVFGQPLNSVVSTVDSGRLHSPTHMATSLPTTPSPITPNSNTFPRPHPNQPIASSLDDGEEVDSEHPLLDDLDLSSKAPSSPATFRLETLLPGKAQIPLIVRQAIQFLDNHGLRTEGIFRVPGAKARIDEIRRKFDRGEDVELTADTNPHDVACLLKEFFRSLPEPLIPRELYHPFLQTRKFQNPGQKRDALRLLCLLLPRPNRDTLQVVLQFFSRVALHANDIILIDGTEVSGNKMSEENLGTILGPNLLHNENKRKSTAPGSYQVTKQDPEELNYVCRVMQELIRMHDTIFTIPADLFDRGLRDLLLSDHEALDAILTRKCKEMGLWESDADVDYPPPSPDVTPPEVSRSRSSDCIHRVSLPVEPTIPAHIATGANMGVIRSRSFSDTERSLEQVMKDLENMLIEGDDRQIFDNHKRHLSNDSAVGESECVSSPLTHSNCAQPSSAFDCTHEVSNSVDSAFSNNSSHTNSVSSTEAVNTRIDTTLESPVPYSTTTTSATPYASSSLPLHARMSSGVSIQSDNLGSSSLVQVSSPKLPHKAMLANPIYSSMPILDPESLKPHHYRYSPSSYLSFWKTNSAGRESSRQAKKKRKISGGNSVENMPDFNPRRSPILRNSPVQISELECKSVVEKTPTGSLSSESAPSLSANISPRFHYKVEPSTEVLI